MLFLSEANVRKKYRLEKGATKKGLPPCLSGNPYYLYEIGQITSLHPVPEESFFSHLRCQEIPLLLLPSNLMLL